MAALLLETSAARPLPAVGPTPSPKAAAFASPAPKRRHLSSKFVGLRATAPLSPTACPIGMRRSATSRSAIVCEAPNTAVNVPEVTKDTWQTLVTKSELPVLVEFWAPWCGPCKMMHPMIAELSTEYSGKIKCFQLNTDANPDIATKYAIRSIPTVMILKGGEKTDAVIGAVPKDTLVSLIEKFA